MVGSGLVPLKVVWFRILLLIPLEVVGLVPLEMYFELRVFSTIITLRAQKIRLFRVKLMHLYWLWPKPIT